MERLYILNAAGPTLVCCVCGFAQHYFQGSDGQLLLCPRCGVECRVPELKTRRRRAVVRNR
jgi:hypothetical protein